HPRRFAHPLALVEEDSADERAAPVLVMSRETARARGLEDGDLAVIHNERARLSARVRIAETTDHGVVVLIRSDASSTAVQTAWINAPGRGLLAENPGRPLVDVARAEAV
ncbi:MAG: hypothetical protein HC882_03955, partial [Acidobacteria bacterium]|nr:hypothetical protein [Acidobacteriota bacterium]